MITTELKKRRIIKLVKVPFTRKGALGRRFCRHTKYLQPSQAELNVPEAILIRRAYCRDVGISRVSWVDVAFNQLDPAHNIAKAMIYVTLKETILLKMPESVKPSKLGA